MGEDPREEKGEDLGGKGGKDLNQGKDLGEDKGEDLRGGKALGGKGRERISTRKGGKRS